MVIDNRISNNLLLQVYPYCCVTLISQFSRPSVTTASDTAVDTCGPTCRWVVTVTSPAPCAHVINDPMMT